MVKRLGSSKFLGYRRHVVKSFLGKVRLIHSILDSSAFFAMTFLACRSCKSEDRVELGLLHE